MRAEFRYSSAEEYMPDDKTFRGGYVGRAERKFLAPRNPLWKELVEVTIAEVHKPAGYTSCHIGKLHLGAEDRYPEKQGSDYNYGGCYFGQPPTYFDPYINNIDDAGDIPTLRSRQPREYLSDREADEACRFIRDHKDSRSFCIWHIMTFILPSKEKRSCGKI